MSTNTKRTRFSRRLPDHVTDELVSALAKPVIYEFNSLFGVVYEHLKLRNAVSGGEEMLRLRAYEKLQNLVSRGLVEKIAGTKTYRGLENIMSAKTPPPMPVKPSVVLTAVAKVAAEEKAEAEAAEKLAKEEEEAKVKAARATAAAARKAKTAAAKSKPVAKKAAKTKPTAKKPAPKAKPVAKAPAKKPAKPTPKADSKKPSLKLVKGAKKAAKAAKPAATAKRTKVAASKPKVSNGKSLASKSAVRKAAAGKSKGR